MKKKFSARQKKIYTKCAQNLCTENVRAELCTENVRRIVHRKCAQNCAQKMCAEFVHRKVLRRNCVKIFFVVR